MYVKGWRLAAIGEFRPDTNASAVNVIRATDTRDIGADLLLANIAGDIGGAFGSFRSSESGGNGSTVDGKRVPN